MADRRERAPDAEETLRTVFEALIAGVYTAMPGIVQAVNAAQMTASVQPTINGRVTDEKGVVSSITMPELQDCPLLWQGGGGLTLTFPVKANDECLIIIASRCIDSWWATGKVSDPLRLRMHDLSDGFALVGVRSKPHAFSFDMTSASLQTDDGTAYLKFNPTTKALVITMPGGINMNGMTVDASGNLTNVGNVTSAGTVNAATAVKVAGTSLTVP